MALSYVPLLLLLLLLVLSFFPPPPSLASITFKNIHSLSEQITKPLNNDTLPPSVFFEVTKPIRVPKTHPCKHLVLHHVFSNTYGKPPVVSNYSFPYFQCGSHREFSKIVLEWNATSKGRQFDRIFGVWLNGVELFRSCTAEPRPNGIFWSVQKDITRYSSLLVRNGTQDFAVYMGNIVDGTYTGEYHVNVSLYFYPKDEKFGGSGADLILPISRNFPLNDGLWFEIENSTDVESKEFVVPRNVYRAVLEVYVSFHENDEFWYGNYPNDFIIANNLTNTPGNGPFREVVVSLDDTIVGAIWPFTVVYTGGINPLLWRPISAIGSYDLPTYDIEITPFLGAIVDGKTHKLGFSVTNALNVWYVDANLHLWLDPKSSKTRGKLIRHESKPVDLSLVSNFRGLNGTFLTTGMRSVSSMGWVESSYGKIVTHSYERFGFSNAMKMENDANLQKVKQVIHTKKRVSFRNRKTDHRHSFSLSNNFRFDMFFASADQGNGTTRYTTKVNLGFYEKHHNSSSDSGLEMSTLENLQSAEGYMIVKNNLVQGGVGNTKQVYRYDGSDSCYFRNISSSNYTILYDKVESSCKKDEYQNSLDGGWLPLLARRSNVASELPKSNGF